ncbi:hypothetical protein llap_22291 [Limosa lapponica baueri]|uniref:Uncharacterized protein n=1 Tax=Limosa lapponica baueri TaxID=1758121 RepID=A0A2I0T0U1_LIMLA|nr:hypothetical protein llap_22291 [Limosa lapponica baueri]
MAEGAGVCVGVKGMLAARKDQKKKKRKGKKKRKEKKKRRRSLIALSTAFEPKVCVFLGEGVFSIPEDEVFPVG